MNPNSYEAGDLVINIYQAEALLVSQRQFSTTIDFFKLRASAAEGEKPDKAEAIFNGLKIWEGAPQEGSRF